MSEELQFFNSSLTGEEIDDELIQLRNVDGYLVGDGHGNFSSATGIYDPSEGTIIRGGYGPPNEYTEGTVGELYLDASKNVFYRCVSNVDNNYVWIQLSYVPTFRKINGKFLSGDITLTAEDIPYKESNIRTNLSDYELGAVIAAFFNACGLRYTTAGYTIEQLSSYFLDLYHRYGGDIELLKNNVFIVET